MPLTLVIVPCLADNYAYLLHDSASNNTALVDAPEAAPIQAELNRRGWKLAQILLTHHHHDHVQGVDALRGNAEVLGAKADSHRLPPLDRALAEGDQVQLAGHQARIFDVSGHTVGHIAAYIKSEGLLFTGDSLMAMGCGRLFEGDADMMWANLQKLRALPDETLVCSGHEYTQTNISFALSVDPDNADLQARAREVDAMRQAGEPTVPSRLGLEKRTNPFMRADNPALAKARDMSGADPVHVFAEIRGKRDNW